MSLDFLQRFGWSFVLLGSITRLGLKFTNTEDTRFGDLLKITLFWSHESWLTYFPGWKEISGRPVTSNSHNHQEATESAKEIVGNCSMKGSNKLKAMSMLLLDAVG